MEEIKSKEKSEGWRETKHRILDQGHRCLCVEEKGEDEVVRELYSLPAG